MSFVGPGSVVTYLVWIEQVQKLNLGNTTQPDQDEVCTHLEGGEYIIKFWNGTEWVKANRYADFLEGETKSFFQNASNLISGVVNRWRLTSLWNDTKPPFIQRGTKTCTVADTWYTETFSYAFTAAPTIATGDLLDSGSLDTIRMRIITTTSCQFSSNIDGSVAHYIAIGRKD